MLIRAAKREIPKEQPERVIRPVKPVREREAPKPEKVPDKKPEKVPA